MKKRLSCLVVAIICLLMPILTSCGDGKYVPTLKYSPTTITLYGIKGEGTTDEAVKAVQDALNEYSEGNLNTRVLIRLFTEDEYYEKLEIAFAAAQKYSDENKNNTPAKPATTGDEEEDSDKKYDMVYPAERGTQVDIFMVRGMDAFNKYNDDGLVAPVKLSDKSALMKKYISDRFLALTNIESAGVLDTKDAYAIPNNTIYGEYTYLLVNKEIAGNFAEKNLDTFAELNNFLAVAARDHKDYITLYNAPDIETDCFLDSLFGSVIADGASAFASKRPECILDDEAYVQYAKYLNLFNSNGYITEGDAYKLPADKNIAAAFIKGSSAIPEQYGEDYLVIPYSKPVVRDVGTMFCVSKYAANTARCLEIINLLQTNVEYRNTFQYGVEDVHYKVDDYTGMLDIISKDYNMDPADTGNLFILKENSSMDEETKLLAANSWELAKLQAREALVPYYFLFEPDYQNLDYKGFMAESDKTLAAVMAYKPGSAVTFEEHVAALSEQFKNSDAYKLLAAIEVEEGETDTSKTVFNQYNSWLKTHKIEK